MIWAILFFSLPIYLYGAGRTYARLFPRCYSPDSYEMLPLTLVFAIFATFFIALGEAMGAEEFDIDDGDFLIAATLCWPLVFTGYWTGRAIRKTWRVFLMGPGTIFRLAIRKGIQHEEKRQ